MDTRSNPERLADLKRHRAELEAGTARPKVPRAVAAAEIRELDREIAAIERQGD